MNADELVQVKEVKPMGLRQMVEASMAELGKALPESLDAERFCRIAMTCAKTNPDLFKCTPESFIGALFTSAQLGIEPIAGMAYLLPFYNSKKEGNNWVRKQEVQFILGYRGAVALFYRHAKAVSINWGVVHENDEFDYQQGTDPFLNHKEADDRGNVLGYWVCAKLLNGGTIFKYMTLKDCMNHAKQHSKTWDKKKNQFYKSSPWATATDSMCLKTVLIQLAKIMPLSVDLHQALQADESSRTMSKSVENILDEPDETNWNDIPDEDITHISEGMD